MDGYSIEPLKTRLLAVGLVVFFLQSCGTSTNPVRGNTWPPPTKVNVPEASTNTETLPALRATEPGDRAAGDCMPSSLTQHIIRIGEYDPETHQAGDVYFPEEPVMFKRVFLPFGFVIPAETSATGEDKTNPQAAFLAPLETKVYSPLDGRVVRIAELWSTASLGDVAIHILPDDLEAGCYVVVELEHVVRPTVRAGDVVKAGQALAEVSPLGAEAQAGLGVVELGILSATAEGLPLHRCPFAYFAPEVSEQRLAELAQMLAAWEDFVADPSLYAATDWVDGVVGCLMDEILER